MRKTKENIKNTTRKLIYGIRETKKTHKKQPTELMRALVLSYICEQSMLRAFSAHSRPV